VFAGTPDDVFDQIRAFNDRMGGIGHLLFFGQGGFLDHRDTEQNISLFGREVAPRLHELDAEAIKPNVAAAE
jgi:alkanesulfonate monooxygenase SsuD/methylene tetrahydromethanopterin reductase-like flavin-dependent oxidoreductase (luciferase family)